MSNKHLLFKRIVTLEELRPDQLLYKHAVLSLYLYRNYKFFKDFPFGLQEG